MSMFEHSSIAQEFLAENLYEVLEEVLRARFRRIHSFVRNDLRKILNARVLKKLCRVAATCDDVASFHCQLRGRITDQTTIVRLLEM
jgi:hypothetical protein